MIHCVLHDPSDSVAVVVVAGVKAGATLVGHTAGPVRPPLSDLKPSEIDELGKLLSKLGSQ